MSTSSKRFTILIVEDVELVCNLIRRILENDGYELLVAASGKQAIDLVESYKGPIHLLICHWTMLDMDGSSVATRIQMLRPMVKVILMSASDPGVPIKDGWTFMQKPFEPVELLASVRDLLSPGGVSIVAETR